MPKIGKNKPSGRKEPYDSGTSVIGRREARAQRQEAYKETISIQSQSQFEQRSEYSTLGQVPPNQEYNVDLLDAAVPEESHGHGTGSGLGQSSGKAHLVNEKGRFRGIEKTVNKAIPVADTAEVREQQAEELQKRLEKQHDKQYQQSSAPSLTRKP